MPESSSRVPLAVSGERPLGAVDEFGYVHLPHDWRVEWWISGDDQWHVPAAASSLRQRSVDNTPVVETALRVPGGDVVWRVAAAATGEGGAIVAELENRASIPVAIGVALVAPPSVPAAPVTRPSVHFTAPARSMASEFGVELLVHPVTHGTTFRCSIGGVGLDALPPIDAIVRGWQTLTRQGTQVDLGDPTRNDALAAARGSLLLHASRFEVAGRRRQRPSESDRAIAAAVASALTLVGHDDAAEALRVGARLKPKRRGLPLVGEPVVPSFRSDALTLLRDPATAAATVAAVRAQLVDDSARRVLHLLPGARESWRGRVVDVTALPTNYGPVSFALRWHGEHPALLWDAPKKVTLRTPALAPDWSTKTQSGEALLAQPLRDGPR